MDEQFRQALRGVLELRHRIVSDPEEQRRTASFRAELENIAPDVCFITHRVKAPISIVKKFQTAEREKEEALAEGKIDAVNKYVTAPERTKDMVGFFVIVNSNQDVDRTIQAITERFAENKNPHSRDLIRDYRREDFRKDKDFKLRQEDEHEIDLDTDKGYQTSDGYKNVRANLLLGNQPIEIQIKTNEQYIAHIATHDPVYKSSRITSEDEKTFYSGKLFPYFETSAHLLLHGDEMTPQQRAQCEKDMSEIFERNKSYFDKHPQVFRDACTKYAVACFMVQNHDLLYEESVLGESVIDSQCVEAEVERVFRFRQKEIQRNNPDMRESDVFFSTVRSIASMSHKTFDKTRQSIAGEFRLGSCIYTDSFDLIKSDHCKLIERLSESYRHIQAGVYSDELVELITGKPPMFTQGERCATVDAMKHVTGTFVVNETGKLNITSQASPLQISEMAEKPYDIGYLPGVFDMLHPGHLQYITNAFKHCKKLVIGAKTDDYVRNVKNKEPVLEQEDRTCVLSSLRAVSEVVVTNNDIMPPKDTLTEFKEIARDSGKVAIFFGSDWVKGIDKDKLEEFKTEDGLISITDIAQSRDVELSTTKGDKAVSECTELLRLCGTYNFDLVNIPREGSQSSTNYRQAGLERVNDVSAPELRAQEPCFEEGGQ